MSKFSSFKELQLIVESWRKFINEAPTDSPEMIQLLQLVGEKGYVPALGNHTIEDWKGYVQLAYLDPNPNVDMSLLGRLVEDSMVDEQPVSGHV